MAQPSFDSILNAVMLAESGGRRYDERGNLLTSSRGAKGEMQVLDKTKFSPGFGVEPARANTPDERARVGRDYLKAMLDRYGDTDKALAAYNWGPGNTDKWIAGGADPAKLPGETKKYISRVKATLSSEPRPTAQAQPEAAPAAAPARGAPAAPVAPTRVSEARPADLGASYQAALALSFLADEDERASGGREYDERQPSAASQWLARETRKVDPESLAMPFSSPFPEPVKAADGGFIAVGFAEGGEAKSDEPTAEELERASKPAFGVVPSSGRGRKQSRVSEALQSGEAQVAAAKGLTMLPQNVVGAPVDIATLVARPFGYNVEKPVMGSEWLKEKSRAAGIAFQEPEDPTLRGFFTAGDIASNLINPAGATRTAVRGVEKTGQAAKELAEFAARPVERDPFLSGSMGSQRGAVRMPGAPDPTLAYLAGVPSAEKPFVGRLDQHVAGLSGTMQKEQFLNSLKGKFRDYDLARASEALADLGPTDKVKPVQILERLQTTYSPQSFRTIIHEPEHGMFHQSTDNVYYDSQNLAKNLPLGVVSLSLGTTKKQEGADKAAELLQNLFKLPSKSFSADDLAFLGNYLKTDLNMSSENLDALVPVLENAHRVGEKFRGITEVKYDLLHPSAVENFRARVMDLYSNNRNIPTDDLIKTIQEEVQKEAFNRLKNFIPSESAANLEKNFFSGNDNAKNAAMDTIETFRSALSNYLDLAGDNLRTSPFGREAINKIAYAQPYAGQHSALKAGRNPIGFSRFSEHTAQVPGMGEVPLMHFHELQSDLMQDLRQYGGAKGSREKDQKEYAELLKKTDEIGTKLDRAENSLREAYAQLRSDGDSYAPAVEKAKKEAGVLRQQYTKLLDRERVLSGREGPRATYRLPEPFAGMETSPQVVQQLLVKNAVNAAIQRGKSGATFPGKESNQPQLYENLLNNLKQVAKDLGPGFEVRPVTLEGPNYTEFSHYGIFWGPEAAARIQKKGVPFKDGGMVERADDTRRYL